MKWQFDKEPWEPGLACVPNYSSASEHLDFARETLEEEINEGMLEKMPRAELDRRYGENGAIAALAVIRR